MEELLERPGVSSESRDLRDELEEIERLMDEVLIYRTYQKDRVSNTNIDKVAEEEINPEDCSNALEASPEVVSRMIISNYNLAVEKLEQIPEEEVPTREKQVHHDGSVSMNESNGPYIGGVNAGPTVPKPDTGKEKNIRGQYENLKENVAILGYNLKTVARDQSDLIDVEDLKSYPKEWMY